MSGIFSGRSSLGTDDAGPTTQTLICPKGQAFVEGKCVDNIEQPPSFPVKADTITTTTTTKTPAVTPATPAVASGTSAGTPWGWIALGVAALGGAWWVMGKGQEKTRRRVRRNGDRVRMPITKFSVGRGKPWSQADADYYWRKADAAHKRGDDDEANEMAGEAMEIEDVLGLRRNGKIIASSFQRYNGGARIKRLHGSSTVTRFYVFREEDLGDASKWLEVEGFGPTPGDRKTDAIRRSGLK